MRTSTPSASASGRCHALRVIAAAVDQVGHAGAARASAAPRRAGLRALGARTRASSRGPTGGPRRRWGCRPPSRSSRRGARRRRRPRRCRSRTARSATCGRPWPTSPRARSPRAGAGACGLAAAHRPKAPSTWHQAPRARQASTIFAIGSNAPVLTSPACAQTIVGPVPAGELGVQLVAPACGPGRPRPPRGCARLPRPSMRQATATVTCAWAPAITRTSGAPCRPCGLDVPARVAQHGVPAAARQVKWAIWQPVTKPTPQSRRQAEQLAHPVAGDLLGDRQRGGDARSRRRSDPRPRSASRPRPPPEARRR